MSNGFRFVRCAGCGTLFTETLPTPEHAMDYGSYYHEGNLRIPRCVQDRLGVLVERFARYRSLNRWLDVGCGAGTLMRAAGSRGWVPVGTEVAPTAADAVSREGFEVHLRMLEDAPFADASFDVVSIVEVVEHVTDAESLLRSARQVLRPGGALYLTTPHGRGFSARTLGLRWSVVAPPEHLQLFSVKGLKALAERSGLRVRELHTHAVNPSELLARLRPAASRPACDRVATRYRLNESLHSNRAGLVTKSAANKVLDILRLGDKLKLTAERPP
jgi:SAM-dependent methyltransferase